MRLLTICATALWLTWSGAAAAQAPVAIEGVYHVVAWPRLDAAGAREWVDGTAVLIDAAQGYLLTAYPVLSGAGSIEILTGDGRRLAARLVGREGDTVAVLQVTGAGLPQPAWVDRPEIEDQTKAMVVGFSHEEGQTARPTTVTAKEYAQTDWLAFDASLPEAMLGAALIDGDGGLIGIVIRATGGAGRKADRALRIDDARAAMNRVVTRTPVRRGVLGVNVAVPTPASAAAAGATPAPGLVVNSVAPGGAAEKAGLQARDMLIAVDGTVLRSAAHLVRTMRALAPGAVVELRYLRERQEATVAAILLPPPPQAPAATPAAR